MRLDELLWDDKNSEHISTRASAEEVEAAVFDPSSIPIRVRSGDYSSEFRRYLFLGLTEEGRFLTVILDYLGNGVGRPVSAREMTDTERARFKSRGK